MSDVPLKDYFEARVTALEKATTVASSAMDKRLDALNEVRGAMKDLSAQMATRAELQMATESIEKDLRDLRDFKAKLEGKASQQSVNVALALSLLSMLISVALKLLD